MAKKIGVVQKVQEELAAAAQREAEIREESLRVIGTLANPVKRERPADLTVVSSGAGYHDFAKEPVFEGRFVGEFLAPKDIPANRTKAGDVIGFTMRNEVTGKEEIISNSYSIKKALEDDKFNTTTLWWFEFEGKIQVKGKPFNQFFVAKR